METSDPITSEFLGNVLNVSSRTARNDIRSLDSLLCRNGAKIESLRGIGYEIKVTDNNKFKAFLREMVEETTNEICNLPSFPEDRVRYIIRKLLLAEGYLKLDDLAEELYISRSTVQNDLKEVKRILLSYDIRIEARPNYGLALKGKELKLRFCMSEYVLNRDINDIPRLELPFDILSKFEMQRLQQLITAKVRENAVVISDIALQNLIIHVAIACRRIRNGNYVTIISNELKEIATQKEYKVANEIVAMVEKELNVLFPETEIAYIAIHLLGTRTISETQFREDEITPFIGEEVIGLAEKIVERVENKMQLGVWEDKELIVSLALHLKPAINRHRFGMNLRNPMLGEIKEKYPVPFEAGVIAGMVIEEELGIQMNENEIAYLSLHIGAALERAKTLKGMKTCMIICASGMGSARLLYYKLRATYGDRLQIAGTTQYYNLHKINFEAVDFVVSTIPIHKPLPVPVIEVNTILGDSDVKRIEKFFGNQDSEKTMKYTREDLVFLQQPFESKEEVLQFLCNTLEQKGLVGSEFYPSVLERERLSPTCFGNLVAIPHPMTPETDETFWTLCTLRKPIQWEEKRVQFVCLLSVQKNGAADLQCMYKILCRVVDDQEVVQRLLKCISYDEFMKYFLKCIPHI